MIYPCIIPRTTSSEEPFTPMEVICARDEVLAGRIVNTKLGYISQKLEDGRRSTRSSSLGWKTSSVGATGQSRQRP